MYEHPIKRAGLSMNRILYSNTKMVMAGFPGVNPQRFNLAFKMKIYSNGKATSTQCKQNLLTLQISRRPNSTKFYLRARTTPVISEDSYLS